MAGWLFKPTNGLGNMSNFLWTVGIYVPLVIAIVSCLILIVLLVLSATKPDVKLSSLLMPAVSLIIATTVYLTLLRIQRSANQCFINHPRAADKPEGWFLDKPLWNPSGTVNAPTQQNTTSVDSP